MKKIILTIIVLLIIGAAGFVVYNSARNRFDPSIGKFHDNSDNVILGLQQYKEFVGSYPAGDNREIAKAMTGQTEKKILILTVRKSELNAKGEIVDPWGTPLQFYFAPNGVLIRSAGPNKLFEDSKNAQSDDLFRTN